MPDARSIINGDPGTHWINDTDKPWYQLNVAGINTCGICWQYDGKLARYWGLPLHHGSMLPGTRLRAYGVVSASQGWFDGPVADITFVDEYRVSVTANHPLLTPVGFAPAAYLVKGDHVVSSAFSDRRLGGVPDDDWQPTLIEEIVESLAVTFGAHSEVMPCSAEDFHGDGRFFHGQVNVVTSDGFLGNGWDIANREKAGKLDFKRADAGLPDLSRAGHDRAVLIGLRDATDGGMRGLRDRASLFLAHLRKAKIGRFADGPNLDPSFAESGLDGWFGQTKAFADFIHANPLAVESDHFIGKFILGHARTLFDHPGSNSLTVQDGNAGPAKLKANRTSIDAKRPRNGLGGLSGLIATNEIRDVVLRHYRGPVYDIGTTSTLYTLDNGSVISNCRCRQSACKPGQQAARPFVDYQEEVEKLPAPQQAVVMGKSLFQLWRKGVIDWGEAVTPGRIRSLQEVVARQRLSIDQLVKAGVRPDIAKAAHSAVHTPAHQAVAAHRKQLIQQIQAAGMSHQAAVQHIGQALSGRVQVAAGPSYTTKTTTPSAPAGTVLLGIPASRITPMPPILKITPTSWTREQYAAELKLMASAPGAVQRARAALSQSPLAKPFSIPPSTAKLVHADDGWQKVAGKVLDRKIGSQEMLNLAGIGHGQASITINGDQVVISASNDQYRLTRTLKQNYAGKIVLQADSFHVAKEHQGSGIGAEVFGRMIQEARRLGVNKIVTFAARSPEENGYWAWPKFGYDTEISGDLRSLLPRSLAGAERLSDLLVTPEGSEWWRQHGTGTSLTFDLTPGSRSMEMWKTYLQVKAHRNPTK